MASWELWEGRREEMASPVVVTVVGAGELDSLFGVPTPLFHSASTPTHLRCPQHGFPCGVNWVPPVSC